MTSPSSESPLLVPNHHGDHPGFGGITGWIAAMTMRKGRAAAAELAFRLTNLVAGDHVVDIGCGPGAAARLAAERGATVIGVDPAEVMLRVARRDDRQAAVTWRQGAAEALPYPMGRATWRGLCRRCTTGLTLTEASARFAGCSVRAGASSPPSGS